MSPEFLRCIVCVVCIHLAKSVNPGFNARITLKGLKYVNDVAIQALSRAVEKTTIPDQHGSTSGLKYSVTNIHVTEFTKPKSDISIAVGQGLTWTASNAYIAIHGDFHYKKWFISDGGSFDAKVSGVDFNLDINIGTATTGHPTVAVRSCSSSIGNVNFKFHGGRAWLYNLFRGKVGNTIKSVLNKQMCTLGTKLINEDGNKKLARIKVTTPLAHKFLLDYRLIKSPLFDSAYLETYHKGEIFWLTDPSTESPVVPSPMADTQDTESMLYLFMSDYMFNTIGDVAQKHGFLTYNLSSKDLPASNRGVLNTSCDSFMCIGKLIPQIGRNYPNSVVDLLLNSTVAPTMNITSSGTYVNCSGSIQLFARNDHFSGAYLLSLNAIMTTTATLWIQNELLYAKIDNLSLKLTLANSSVGPVNDKFLDFLINQALKLYLIPNLNDLGSKGFPFPVTDEIKFVNTSLTFAKNTILISTDLNYKPSEQNANDVFIFVPKNSHVRLPIDGSNANMTFS